MVNKTILIGRTGKDPEVRKLDSGVAVTKFSLATSERWKDSNGEQQESTEWHNIVCWRLLAETVEKYLRKGMLIYVEGKLTHRKYQDKDGNDRYTTEVVAHTVRFLEKRDSHTQNGQQQAATTAEPQLATADSPADDLPF